MKVFVHGPYNSVSKIEFCCSEIAEDILLGRIKTTPWTDHPLVFRIITGMPHDFPLKHCPHCGAKIRGGIIDDSRK